MSTACGHGYAHGLGPDDGRDARAMQPARTPAAAAGAHAAAKASQLGLEVDPLAVGRLVDAPLQEAVGRQQEQCRHERQ